MKYLKFFAVTALLFISVNGVLGQTKPASAAVIIKEAEAEAAKTNKNVFIIFHASWCGWCHKMDNSMNDANLKSFFDKNYVVVHLTVDESRDKKQLENPGAVELRKKYNGELQGLPYWFILDAKGNLLADSRLKTGNAKAASVGCPASKEEVDYFVQVLKKTSSLNSEQLSLIEGRFLKNSEVTNALK
jgi:thiol-disulfide isomerase/thioredoxin